MPLLETRREAVRSKFRGEDASPAQTRRMTADIDRVPLQEVRDLLRLGELLPFSVLDAHERLLLNAGQRLVDEAQFDALIDRGAWALRSLVEAERAARALAAGSPATVEAAVLLPSLFDRWERLLWQFDKISRGLARAQLPASVVPTFWHGLQQLVDVDPDVALFFCLRQDDRRFALYAQHHAIHCAVVTLLAARLLAWPAARLDALGCAALTMNLGMLELQAQMAEQSDPPTQRQRDRIRAHPEGAVALLRAAGITDTEWLTTVLQHHEQPQGGGYPHGLTQVTDAAQLLRVADVYMAKVSPRALRAPLTPVMAMRQLFQQQPGDPLAMALIKALGIHPPGALVQLQSGEAAVVIRRPSSGTHPFVATLSDTQGRPVPGTQRRDTAAPGFGIQGPLAETKPFARVLPDRVYGWIPG
jgi:HD-GYP domain-containing protein (c-di-GMP phosphodiesterase class II)